MYSHMNKLTSHMPRACMFIVQSHHLHVHIYTIWYVLRTSVALLSTYVLRNCRASSHKKHNSLSERPCFMRAQRVHNGRNIILCVLLYINAAHARKLVNSQFHIELHGYYSITIPPAPLFSCTTVNYVPQLLYRCILGQDEDKSCLAPAYVKYTELRFKVHVHTRERLGLNVTVLAHMHPLCIICISVSSCVLHIPYSGKLSREKTVADFVVLWLFTKVFSAKFWGGASFGTAKASNPRKFSLRKSYFHQSVKVFSFESFPLYGTCLLHQPRTQATCLEKNGWQ